MNYKVYFTCIDHSSDDASVKESTIVKADTIQEVVKKFYGDVDMSGCHIEEIILVTW